MSARLFGNGTDLVHWKASPNTRGTFDILTTCIITMLLCVWTAVHLNVPPPGSTWGPRLRKVGWLILALLAPERVAYTAWYQRQEALSTMRQVNKAFGLSNPPSWYEKTVKDVKKAVTGLIEILTHQKQRPIRQPTLEAQPSPEARRPWTIVHGFYANMGGIAFEIPEKIPESQNFLPSHCKETWFITKYLIGVLSRSETGRKVIPDLSQDEIESKSKANGLAKALICIQALWFIAQCITRLAQRIPITLLELNTFGHAVCALLIYFLWWEKPFGVDYPSIIECPILWDLYALRWIKYNRSPAFESYFRDLEDRLKRDKWFQTQENQKKLSIILQDASEDFVTVPTQDRGHNGEDEAGSNVLMPGETIQGTGYRVLDMESLAHKLGQGDILNFKGGSHSPLPELNLTTTDVTRYQMASRASELLYEASQPLCESFPEGTAHYRVMFRSETIVRRCKDWPDTNNVLELPVALGSTTAVVIYGGIHALAWTAYFGSSRQQLLWRIAACVVMGGLPVILILTLVREAIGDGTGNKILDSGSFYLLIITAIALAVLTYMLARGYLVVECFINLSHLPAGVYDVPQWSAYFPHIS